MVGSYSKKLAFIGLVSQGGYSLVNSMVPRRLALKIKRQQAI